MKKILATFCVLVMLPSLSYGQIRGADVYGTVVMPDGSAIPGVIVTLIGDVLGRRTTVTSEEGNFRFIQLPPGTYQLKFEIEGFKTVERKSITLPYGSNSSVSIAMEIDEAGGLPSIPIHPTPAPTGGPRPIELPLKRERKTEIIELAENYGIDHEELKAIPKNECNFYYEKKKLYAKYGVAKVDETKKALKDITDFPYESKDYITEGLEITPLGVYVIKIDQKERLLFIRILKIHKDRIQVEYLPPK